MARHASFKPRRFSVAQKPLPPKTTATTTTSTTTTTTTTTAPVATATIKLTSPPPTTTTTITTTTTTVPPTQNLKPAGAPFPFSFFPFLYPIIHPPPQPTGVVRIRHAIDTAKFLALIVPILIVARFDAWKSHTATLYVAMHGTYGAWWLVKSALFPDRRWDAYCPIWYFCVVQVMLCSYFAIPYYICANNVELAAWRLMLTVMVWASGILLTFTADLQKTILLELAPGQLINTKFFYHLRNPNYLGEAMNYLAFCSLAGHWLPMVHQICVILLACVPGIVMKERSLRRYPAFRDWEARSYIYIPFIW